MNEPNFLFLGLDDYAKELLTLACAGTEWIELTPLDKGLSGSLVLMGRWSISGASSKFHVFKIGDPRKLKREYDAIVGIAAPLVRNFPNAAYWPSKDGKRAILSQEFLGDGDGSTTSLRQFIERAKDDDSVRSILDRLYSERIIDWLPKQHQKPIETTVNIELQNWISKGDFDSAVREVGEDGLQDSISERFGVNLQKIKKLIRLVLDAPVTVEKGPVHGDLHSQNVIVDRSNRINLIDFGWTAIRWRAIDYLWLECSLKFVVASPYARLGDLLGMEEKLDKAWGDDKPFDTSVFDGLLEGVSLKKIAAGIDVIRKNARAHVSGLNLSDYRKGLIGMMSALTTFPQLNRPYLIHSMARNSLSLEQEVSSGGPYRKLYQPSIMLWPNRPGRMVRKAAEQIANAGKAMDIGCGDGKDVIYLEDRGWTVTAFDVNQVAIANLAQRQSQHFGSMHVLKGRVAVADASKYEYPSEEFDLVIAYGLYHCLDDETLSIVHHGAVQSLKPGGLFAFAAFNDTLPVPDGHGTDDLVLRHQDHIFDMVQGDFDVIDREVGTITEVHPPLVNSHSHGLTWGLFRKKVT
jgi:SAM-dependent methyltransferase